MDVYGNRFFASCYLATIVIVTIRSAFEPRKIRAPTHTILMTSSTLPVPLHAVNTFDHLWIWKSVFSLLLRINVSDRRHLNGLQTR